MKIVNYIMGAGMMVLLTACPPPCESGLINYGSLDEESMDRVPFQDGSYHTFLHSEGQEILFSCSRSRTMVSDYMDCMEIQFEEDLSTLSPDYPVFNCVLRITKVDSMHSSLDVYVGPSGFHIPFDPEISYGEEYDYMDSLELGGTWHPGVYRIPGNQYYWEEEPEGYIQADTLYYNRESGILKIIMSNGEYFQYVP